MGQQTPAFSLRGQAYLAAFDMRASSNANTSPVGIPAGPQSSTWLCQLQVQSQHRSTSSTGELHLLGRNLLQDALLHIALPTVTLSVRTADEHAVGCRVLHVLLRCLPCICCCSHPQHVHCLHQEQMQHSSKSREPCLHLHLYMLTNESAYKGSMVTTSLENPGLIALSQKPWGA